MMNTVESRVHRQRNIFFNFPDDLVAYYVKTKNTIEITNYFEFSNINFY